MKLNISYYVKGKKLKKDEIKALRDEVDHPIVTDTFINAMYVDTPGYKNKFVVEEDKIFAYKIIFIVPKPQKEYVDKLYWVSGAFRSIQNGFKIGFKVKIKAYYPSLSYLKDEKKIGMPNDLKVILTNE